MRKWLPAKRASAALIRDPCEYWRFISFALACFLLALLWYGFLPYHTFMGDDLWLISDAQNGGVCSSFVSGMTQASLDKYRPVTYSLLALQIGMFRDNFAAYGWVNIFLQSLNAILMGLIAWRLSKRWYIALVSGLLLVTSRFSNYSILQVLGFMEGMAIFFLLLIILTTIRAYQKKSLRAFCWPLIFFGLLVFTHERFIVVGGFLVIAILLSPSNVQWTRKLLLALVPFVVAISNYMVKVYVIKIDFFTGAAGTKLAFNPSSFTHFMFWGVINILGFNKGPNYLSGLDLAESGYWGIGLGCALLLPLVILLLVYLSDQLLGRRKSSFIREGRKTLLFASLILPLLASASITFRQEHRWLYAPSCVLVLAVAYLAGKVRDSHRLSLILLLLIALAAFSIDGFYRGYLSNVYLAQGLKFSDSAKNFMIDAYDRELAGKDVYLITNGDITIKNWYLSDNNFFKLYTHSGDVHVNYVNDINDIYLDPGKADNAFVFVNKNGEVRDITAKARPILSARRDLRDENRFDFLGSFKLGKINSTANVSTPTGQGAFITDSPGDFGVIRSLTILSGFNYRYDGIDIKSGDYLFFKAGLFFDESQTDGALAYVDLITSDSRIRISTSQLVPAKKPMDLKPFNIALDQFAGKKVAFVFGVESPTGNQNGDWLSFSEVNILHRSPEKAIKNIDNRSR